MVFEPISLDKRTDYLELLNGCPQVGSDYSFLNLWAWADEYGLRWAWEDNLVWIRQSRPHELLWAPVGPWNQIDWKSRFVENRSRQTDFIRVPQQLADSWDASFGDAATATVAAHPPPPSIVRLLGDSMLSSGLLNRAAFGISKNANRLFFR